jgi:hypothetical protein
LAVLQTTLIARADVEGRTSVLLKVKSFHDAECIVIGYEGGKGKYAGQVRVVGVRVAVDRANCDDDTVRRIAL